MTIVLSGVSCRSSRSVSKVSVSEERLSLLGDTMRQLCVTSSQVSVRLSRAGMDTLMLSLSAGMVDSLPEGASWVEQRNGATLVATKTKSGMMVTALHPRPPDVCADASATGTTESSTMNSAMLQDAGTVEAEAEAKPLDGVQPKSAALILGVIVAMAAIVAILRFKN